MDPSRFDSLVRALGKVDRSRRGSARLLTGGLLGLLGWGRAEPVAANKRLKRRHKYRKPHKHHGSLSSQSLPAAPACSTNSDCRQPASYHTTGTCTNGSCSFACDDGWGDCNGSMADGCETSLETLQNCGRCGYACPVSDCENGNGAVTCMYPALSPPCLCTATQ